MERPGWQRIAAAALVALLAGLLVAIENPATQIENKLRLDSVGVVAGLDAALGYLKGSAV